MFALTSRSVVFAFIFLITAQTVVLADASGFKASVGAMPGWGLEVGRADQGDVAELLADQVALQRAMTRVNEALKADLGKERRAALLGEEGTKGMGDLMAAAEKWWDDNIDGPIERISKNPAASCDESRAMLALILSRARQRQLLGLPSANAEDVFNGPVAKNVRQRCREEKLDECNATGRFDQIIKWAIEEARSTELVGGIGDADPGHWRAEALTECANYELHYVSTTSVSDAFKLDSVIDGRIPIKYKPSGEGVTEQPIIEGEIGTGENPFLQKFVCDYGDISVTCSRGDRGVYRNAYGRILDMEIKHREYSIDANGKSQSKVEGENKLDLKFMSAIMGITAVVKPPDGPSFNFPFLEAGGTGFWIAHKKNRFEENYVKFTDTTRGTYPIMFEFTRADSDVEDDVPGTDSTKFELIHKPNKKPFVKDPTPPRRVVRTRT